MPVLMMMKQIRMMLLIIFTHLGKTCSDIHLSGVKGTQHTGEISPHLCIQHQSICILCSHSSTYCFIVVKRIRRIGGLVCHFILSVTITISTPSSPSTSTSSSSPLLPQVDWVSPPCVSHFILSVVQIRPPTSISLGAAAHRFEHLPLPGI